MPGPASSALRGLSCQVGGWCGLRLNACALALRMEEELSRSRDLGGVEGGGWCSGEGVEGGGV